MLGHKKGEKVTAHTWTHELKMKYTAILKNLGNPYALTPNDFDSPQATIQKVVYNRSGEVATKVYGSAFIE